MDRESFERYYGTYRKHPAVVETGIDGLPILEVGKFYIIVHMNDYTKRTHWSSGHVMKLVRCATQHNFHGGENEKDSHAVSYWLDTQNIEKLGCVQIAGHYHWFGVGRNIILELPKEEQTLYRNLWKGLEKRGACAYSHKLIDAGFKDYNKL